MEGHADTETDTSPYNDKGTPLERWRFVVPHQLLWFPFVCSAFRCVREFVPEIQHKIVTYSPAESEKKKKVVCRRVGS